MSYSVSPSGNRSRPWAVVVSPRGRIVELHRDEESAQRGADRANRVCFACGAPNGEHTPECHVRDYERDPSFGAEPDDD